MRTRRRYFNYAQTAKLRRRIEAFLVRNKMAPTAFGRKVCNDPMLVRELRAGRKVYEVLHRKIEAVLNPPKASARKGAPKHAHRARPSRAVTQSKRKKSP